MCDEKYTAHFGEIVWSLYVITALVEKIDARLSMPKGAMKNKTRNESCYHIRNLKYVFEWEKCSYQAMIQG
jgi:hypothetical protein